MDAEAIERMLQASHDNAKADMETRALREAQIEARQLIHAINSAKEVDESLLIDEEASRIDAVITQIESVIQTGPSARILELTKELNRASSDFAARRMDLYIGKALKGETIDEAQ